MDSGFRRAERFLEQYGIEYRDLLARVRQAADKAREALGPGAVHHIYSRGDDAKSGSPFKDARKIAFKARRDHGRVTAETIVQLNDIIGLTVVVQYPDQVDPLRKALRKFLGNAIGVASTETHKDKGGYFATHVVYRKRYGTEELRCEVQIKTLLHDAWSAKMHDLTYKPSGMLDPRLGALMASIASTLASLESQSEMIRDMIKAGWNVEEDTRKLAREAIFNDLLRWNHELWKGCDFEAEANALKQRIEDSESWIREESPEKSARFKDLTDIVRQCCSSPDKVRFGWLLAGRIATLRPDRYLVRFFMSQADQWLDAAPRQIAGNTAGGKEVQAVPLMFYAMGELDLAIDYSDQILEDARFNCLDPNRRMRIAFNRANFSVEREYHYPSPDKSQRDQIKADALASAEAIMVAAVDDAETSAADLRGMVAITFADTMEEVRDGIRQCMSAVPLSPQDEQDISEAYADLNVRLGWRRYFELEVRRSASAAKAATA